MKKFSCFLFVFAAVFFAASAAVAAPKANGAEKLPKYIILFIGDGMSTPQRMLAEEFLRKSGKPGLAMNHMPYHCSTRSGSANSIVTDSAASGTAIACGTKTANGRIGVDASGKVRLQSAAEVARDKKWKVGIISTMTINHATPASFYGHRAKRQMYYELGIDLIESGFDFFAGGGIARGKNKEGADLYALARKKGYKTIVGDKKAFLALKPGCGKVIYSDMPGYMTLTIDAPQKAGTLAEMTAKGLELLKNPKGFFLMVEGGAIDTCGHANDPAGNLQETLELDKAVKVALNFAAKHPAETLIVVTGDHETGGMSLGCSSTGYALYPERLLAQKISAARFHALMKETRAKNKALTFADAQKMLTANFGFKFSGDVKKDPMVVTTAQKQLLADGFKAKRLAYAARTVMSQKAGVGWTTGSHTALPILTTATGVQAHRFSGYIENTDISRIIKSFIR